MPLRRGDHEVAVTQGSVEVPLVAGDQPDWNVHATSGFDAVLAGEVHLDGPDRLHRELHGVVAAALGQGEDHDVQGALVGVAQLEHGQGRRRLRGPTGGQHLAARAVLEGFDVRDRQRGEAPRLDFRRRTEAGLDLQAARLVGQPEDGLTQELSAQGVAQGIGAGRIAPRWLAPDAVARGVAQLQEPQLRLGQEELGRLGVVRRLGVVLVEQLRQGRGGVDAQGVAGRRTPDDRGAQGRAQLEAIGRLDPARGGAAGLDLVDLDLAQGRLLGAGQVGAHFEARAALQAVQAPRFERHPRAEVAPEEARGRRREAAAEDLALEGALVPDRLRGVARRHAHRRLVRELAPGRAGRAVFEAVEQEEAQGPLPPQVAIEVLVGVLEGQLVRRAGGDVQVALRVELAGLERDALGPEVLEALRLERVPPGGHAARDELRLAAHAAAGVAGVGHHDHVRCALHQRTQETVELVVDQVVLAQATVEAAVGAQEGRVEFLALPALIGHARAVAREPEQHLGLGPGPAQEVLVEGAHDGLVGGLVVDERAHLRRLEAHALGQERPGATDVLRAPPQGRDALAVLVDAHQERQHVRRRFILERVRATARGFREREQRQGHRQDADAGGAGEGQAPLPDLGELGLFFARAMEPPSEAVGRLRAADILAHRRRRRGAPDRVGPRAPRDRRARDRGQRRSFLHLLGAIPRWRRDK